MTERKLVSEIEKYLKKIHLLWFYKSSDQGTSGIPDLIICYKGQFIALEVKTKTGKTRKLQGYFIRKIGESGGISSIVRSVEDVKDIIEGLSWHSL